MVEESRLWELQACSLLASSHNSHGPLAQVILYGVRVNTERLNWPAKCRSVAL